MLGKVGKVGHGQSGSQEGCSLAGSVGRSSECLGRVVVGEVAWLCRANPVVVEVDGLPKFNCGYKKDALQQAKPSAEVVQGVVREGAGRSGAEGARGGGSLP